MRKNFPPHLATLQAWSYRAYGATQTLLFSKPFDLAQVCHGLCDFQLWPCPWIFKVKIRESCIPGLGWPIDMELRWCELIGTLTHFVTLNFDFTHDLDLGFSRSNLKKVYLRNQRFKWHGIKGIWVDRMLNPLCDLELWFWPWCSKSNCEIIEFQGWEGRLT